MASHLSLKQIDLPLVHAILLVKHATNGQLFLFFFVLPFSLINYNHDCNHTDMDKTVQYWSMNQIVAQIYATFYNLCQWFKIKVLPIC